MFDNGSEITLITHIFARKAGLTHEDASYAIAGIGSNSTVCEKGKIYNVPLLDSEGNKILIKAFGVDQILSEKIGRDQVTFNEDEFPDVPNEVLIKVGKALPKKYLDILIGNSNLGLKPVCNYGFGYQNCSRGRCLYRS